MRPIERIEEKHRRKGLSVKDMGVFAQLVSETSIKMIDVEDLD